MGNVSSATKAISPYRATWRKSLAAGCAAKDTLVADAAGDPVVVVALEQELGGSARDSEHVAEAGERDRAQRQQRLEAALVKGGRDGKPVAHALEPALLLEVGREL